MNRFEVAVIGLEKAGKSALLNAWLGQEILPSAAERCTYTTTEIWSAPTEDDQELYIEYFSREAVDRILAEKKQDLKSCREGSSDYDDLDSDIKETEKNLSKIYDYARTGKTVYKFQDIAEIEERLQQAVFKNKAEARAIQNIRLKTTRLRNDKDIVFHDVPGFDSPVVMHKQQAEQKLADCDAIIYAKKMDNPNINSPEKNMLQVADAEDKYISVADKVFVVLTKIDMARDKSEYDDWLHKHKQDWQDVPESRLVPVCAAAHLAKSGMGSDATNRQGQQSIENLQTLKVDDGIQRLKQSVDDYINHERASVLEKRCDKLVSVFQAQAQQIFGKLAHYSQTEGDVADESEVYGREFNTWWGGKWHDIQKEFKNWYLDTIDCRETPDGSVGEHEKLAELHGAYTAEVEKLFDDLKISQADEMERIYTSETRLVSVPARGNQAIRKQLYPQLKQALRVQLPNILATSLQDMLKEVATEGQKCLYGIDSVFDELLEKDINDRLQYGFETLFLRFSRVAVDVFIELPLSDRSRLLEDSRYEPEIRTLEAFYRGTKQEQGNLMGYLQQGSWFLQVASVAGVVSPVVGAGVRAIKNATEGRKESLAELLNMPSLPDTGSAGSISASAPKQIEGPQDFEGVKKEIQDDLSALKDYLINSVFYAAGFVTYSQQELQRLRDRFIELEDNERRWDHIIRREVRRHNQNIPFKIETRMQDVRMQREIALELKEARESLGKLLSPGQRVYNEAVESTHSKDSEQSAVV